MNTAPISVVIPAYNSERFLTEAIQSVHAQTLPVTEIIVVDDGSSDNTAAVAASLGASVTRQPHRGISAARNAGIGAASCEWIAFLDADDLWMPEKMECQWSAIRRYPNVGLVSCELVQFQEGCETKPETVGAGKLSDIGDAISYIPRPQGAFLANGMSYNSPSIIVRKEILLDIGLFDERLRYAEGVECYLRVIARCPVALVKRPLVTERLHAQNHSLNYINMSLDWIRMVDMISAHPEKYSPGAAEAMGLGVSDALVPLARGCLERGRQRDARTLLIRSLRRKFSRRAIMLWSLTFVTPVAFKRLLAIKHRVLSTVRPTAVVAAEDQAAERTTGERTTG